MEFKQLITHFTCSYIVDNALVKDKKLVNNNIIEMSGYCLGVFYVNDDYFLNSNSRCNVCTSDNLWNLKPI